MLERDEIAREALALAPQDRAYLADVLERSLDAETFATPEIAAAWSTEIDRRIGAYDRGETRGIEIEAALAHVRKALENRKITRSNSS